MDGEASAFLGVQDVPERGGGHYGESALFFTFLLLVYGHFLGGRSIGAIDQLVKEVCDLMRVETESREKHL